MNDLLCLHVEDSKKISWNKKRKMEKSGRREACVVRFLNIPTGITTSKILEIIFHILTDFTKRQCFTIVPYVNLKKLRSLKVQGILKGTTRIRRWGVSPAKWWKTIRLLFREISRNQGNVSIVKNGRWQDCKD